MSTMTKKVAPGSIGAMCIHHNDCWCTRFVPAAASLPFTTPFDLCDFCHHQLRDHVLPATAR